MGLLGNVGLTSGSEGGIDSIDADTVYYDSTKMSLTKDDSSIAIVRARLQSISLTDEPASEVSAMPLPGTIIAVVWQVTNNTADPQTHKIDVIKNGVVIGTAVIIVPGGSSGVWLKSATLDLTFVAGDKIEYSRIKSGATVGGIVGALGLAVKWD